MLINKLKERLESELSSLKKQIKEPSNYSYLSGRKDEIEIVLEWINDLPSKEKVEEIIKKIEENNCQDYYSYMCFNYKELLKLKELL